MNKVETIRSIMDGDAMTFSLDEVNVDAYRSRCGELNRADGWTHYSVSVNRIMNTMIIKAYGRD